MASTRKCPDCWLDGVYFISGDGNCSHCQGTGIFSGLLVRGILDSVCDVCSGTGQCQTCGGTGLVSLESEENQNEDEETEVDYDTDYSTSDSSSNSEYSGLSYTSNDKTNIHNSDPEGTRIIITILAGVTLFICLIIYLGSLWIDFCDRRNAEIKYAWEHRNVTQENSQGSTKTEINQSLDFRIENPLKHRTGPGNKINEEEAIFKNVEVMPSFPGGENKLEEFISNNINYPSASLQNRIQGRVYISFIVQKDGKIKDSKVVSGISDDCDSEALRLVRTMPDWNPGKQNGRNVNVQYILPLSFIIK